MTNAEIKSTPEINIWHENLSVSTHIFMPVILNKKGVRECLLPTLVLS